MPALTPKSAGISLPVQKKAVPLPHTDAVVAQSVEHQLPKLRVAGSTPVYRSRRKSLIINTMCVIIGGFVVLFIEF